ncbi:MAG: hypothetical protein ABIY50_06070 [Ignavibacteria bacterium]
MKILTTLLLFLVTSITFSQDLDIIDSPYDVKDESISTRKAFQREKWFYEQRMYPNNFIPKDAYKKAYEQKMKLTRENGYAMNSVFGSWTNVGPTTGFYFAYSNITSRMATVMYDPNNANTIYIGAAAGGIWKSTNAGLTWSAKSDNEVSLSSGSLAIDPSNSDILYYMTGEATYSVASYYGRGLLKSTDGGDTWTSYTSGLPSSSYTNRIVVRPNHSNEIFASMGNAGLYKSINSGINWSLVVSGRCDDIIFTPTGDTAYVVGSGTGYRVSTNGGSSFTLNATLSMGSRNHIAVSKSSPEILYCAKYSGSAITIWKSINYGSTFSQVVVGQDFNGGQAWYDFYIHINPADANISYVGSVDIWRTTNGGTSNFTNVSLAYSGGNVHPDQQNVAFHPTDPNQMLCVNDGGIWKSANKGSTWTNLNNSLTLTQFYRIASDPSNSNHILGGTQDNGTQRTLGAINWSAAFGGDGGEVCFHSVNNSYMLGETQNNGVYRSTNGGSSWASATSGLSGTATWVGPIMSHPDSAGIYYTARTQVFKTTNWGSSWFAISSGTSGTIREMGIGKSSPEIMYASSGSTLYKSTNRGYTYSNVSSGSGMPTRTITSVNVHPDSSLVAIVTFSGFGSGKIFKTTNGGTSWINVSGNLPDSPANDGLIFYPNMSTGVYFIAMDVGVFVTYNYGQSWTELANGLPNTVAMHMDYHLASNKLRIGTHGRGVWEIVVELPPVEVNVTVIPQGFYNQSSNRLNSKDTVEILVRNTFAPYAIVDSGKSIIDSVSFTGAYNFTNTTTGTYFIVAKHRNSIETWSKSPGESLSQGNVFNYDFTTSASQAFGNNMILVGSKYCIYSGDTNQDGVVDGNDLSLIDNDAAGFAMGYIPSDINGDGMADGSDASLASNNALEFVSKITP